MNKNIIELSLVNGEHRVIVRYQPGEENERAGRLKKLATGEWKDFFDEDAADLLTLQMYRKKEGVI